MQVKLQIFIVKKYFFYRKKVLYFYCFLAIKMSVYDYRKPAEIKPSSRDQIYQSTKRKAQKAKDLMPFPERFLRKFMPKAIENQVFPSDEERLDNFSKRKRVIDFYKNSGFLDSQIKKLDDIIEAEQKKNYRAFGGRNDEIVKNAEKLKERYKKFENASERSMFGNMAKYAAKGFGDLKGMVEGAFDAPIEMAKSKELRDSAIKNPFNLVKSFSAARKMKSGEALTAEETLAMESEILEQLEMERDQHRDYFEKVGRGAGGSIPFMAEFALTRGAGKAAKESVNKAVGKKLESQVQKKLINGVASVGGVAAQVGLMPTTYKKIEERYKDTPFLSKNSEGEVEVSVEDGDDFLESVAKGFGSQFFEVGSEHFGAVIQPLLGKVPKSEMVEAFQSVLAQKWAKLRGVRGAEAEKLLNSVKKNVGWNGIITEVLEEEVNEPFQAAIDEREYNAPIFTKEGTERFWEEVGVITLIGSTMKGVELAPRGIDFMNNLFSPENVKNPGFSKVPFSGDESQNLENSLGASQKGTKEEIFKVFKSILEKQKEDLPKLLERQKEEGMEFYNPYKNAAKDEKKFLRNLIGKGKSLSAPKRKAFLKVLDSLNNENSANSFEEIVGLYEKTYQSEERKFKNAKEMTKNFNEKRKKEREEDLKRVGVGSESDLKKYLKEMGLEVEKIPSYLKDVELYEFIKDGKNDYAKSLLLGLINNAESFKTNEVFRDGGYSGYSKSNRAKSAEASGRFPATNFEKNYNLPRGFLKKMGFKTDEYHHTSKFYNSVDYYSPYEVIEQIIENYENIDDFGEKLLEAGLVPKKFQNSIEVSPTQEKVELKPQNSLENEENNPIPADKKDEGLNAVEDTKTGKNEKASPKRNLKKSSVKKPRKLAVKDETPERGEGESETTEEVPKAEVEAVFSSRKILPSPAETQNDPKFVMPEEKWYHAFRRSIEDSNFRIKQLVAKIQEENGETKASFDEELDLWNKKDELPRLLGENIRQVNVMRMRLARDMAADNISFKELSDYLQALQAPSRNQKMRERAAEEGREIAENPTGMSDQEAAEILEKVEKSGKIEIYKKYESILRDLIKKSMDLKVQSGLLKQSDADKILESYEYYVPLQREFKDEETFLDFGQSSKMADVKGKEVKRAVGSSREVLNVVSNIFAEYENTLARISRNEVAKTILSMVEKYPELKSLFVIKKQKFKPQYDKDGEITFLQPEFQLGENFIGFKKDGIQYFVEIKDKKLAQALRSSNLAELNSVFRTMRTAMMIYQSMMTRFSPEFMLVNFERDLAEALANVKTDAKAAGMDKSEMKKLRRSVAKNVFKNWVRIYKYLRAQQKGGKPTDAGVDQFFKLGGDIGHFWTGGFGQASENLLALEKAIAGKGTAQTLKNIGKSLLDLVDHLNSAIELGVRLSVFEEFVKRGVSPKKAIRVSSDITINFARQGEITPLLKSFVLFVNPAVQGPSKIIRVVKQTPQILLGMVAAGFVFEMAKEMFGGDDEMTREWKKASTFTFSGEGKEYTIWYKPYGYSYFLDIGRHAFDLSFRDKDFRTIAKNNVQSLLRSFSPVQKLEDLVGPASPYFDLRRNKNHWGSKIYPDTFNSHLPDYLVYKQTASDTAVETAQFLYKMSGGAIDVHPDSLDYLVKSYTASLGKFIINTGETAGNAAKGEEINANNVPFLRKFYYKQNAEMSARSNLSEFLEESSGVKLSDKKIKEFETLVSDYLKRSFIEDDDAKKYLQDFYKSQIFARDTNRERVDKNLEYEDYKAAKKLQNDLAFAKAKEETPELYNKFVATYSDSYQKTFEKRVAQAQNRGETAEKFGEEDKNEILAMLNERKNEFWEFDRNRQKGIIRRLKEDGFSKEDIYKALDIL